MILSDEERVEGFLRRDTLNAYTLIEILQGTLGLAEPGDPRLERIATALDNLIVKRIVIGKEFAGRIGYERHYFIIHPQQV